MIETLSVGDYVAVEIKLPINDQCEKFIAAGKIIGKNPDHRLGLYRLDTEHPWRYSYNLPLDFADWMESKGFKIPDEDLIEYSFSSFGILLPRPTGLVVSSQFLIPNRVKTPKRREKGWI